MDWVLVLLVIVGAVILYVAASLSTYSSFALYGALTLFLVGLALIPLLETKEEGEPAPTKKKKR